MKNMMSGELNIFSDVLSVGENMKTTTVAIVLSVVAALVFTVVVGVLVKRGTISKLQNKLLLLSFL